MLCPRLGLARIMGWPKTFPTADTSAQTEMPTAIKK